MTRLTLKQVFRQLASDARRYQDTADPDVKVSTGRFLVLLLRPSMTTLLLYRLSHWAHLKHWRALAGTLYRLNLFVTGADISPMSEIGPGCLIVHTVGTVIQARIGSDVTIFTHVVIQPDHPAAPVDQWPLLGNEIMLGTNTTVIGPVSIADRVTVASLGLIDRSIEHSDSLISATPGKDRLVVRKEQNGD